MEFERMKGGQFVLNGEMRAQVICKDDSTANFVWVLPDEHDFPVVWPIDELTLIRK